MRRVSLTATILLTALWVGCASLPTSGSLRTFQVLRIKEIGGLYPPDWHVAGDSHAMYLSRLQKWAGEQGIVVAAAPIAKRHLLGHSSRTLLAGWIILISEDLPPNNRLYTLLHELGHVFGPHNNLGIDEAETIAEMVAAQSCEAVGLNVWPQTAAYLSTYVPLDRQVFAVNRHGVAIDAIVVRLSVALGAP